MAADRQSLLRVGLTGNIGAGKSTVGRILEDGGCLVLDADRLAHQLLTEDSEVSREILEAFGPTVFTADGDIARKALAKLVFADSTARRRLESITHPRILRLEERAVDAWEVRRGIVVTEAALLVETGGAARYHRLVVVVADDRLRVDRLVARGMERQDAVARMAAQMDQTIKAAAGDYVIDNSGAREATAEQVDRLIVALREDLERLLPES